MMQESVGAAAKWMEENYMRNHFHFCKIWQLSEHHIPNIKTDGIDVG